MSIRLLIKRNWAAPKRYMQDRGLTAREMYRNILGLACVQTVYRWTAGGISIPTVDNLYAFESIDEYFNRCACRIKK